MTQFIQMTVINLVTPKAAAKLELFQQTFLRPACDTKISNVIQKRYLLTVFNIDI